MRDHATRPREDQRGIRRAAARDVSHADRLPAEHGGRAGVAPGGGRRRRRPTSLMTRSIYRRPWRIDLDVRDGIRSPLAGAALARTAAVALDEVGAPAPASIGLILSDDA